MNWLSDIHNMHQEVFTAMQRSQSILLLKIIESLIEVGHKNDQLMTSVCFSEP